ncbi:ectonucleotide pyrophosphatase/phosphodiesterase [Roseiterribacter gracilis]|uniref:Alkaline phosphatase family protein n=1 Tax=Roseiterribacter gracilis TaxID=2812848 RepID=A0A8S8XGL7_9PROT|nr:alkaline phosphatase family protein [Rhodospirillales bacterium TMPK1]
MRTLVGSILALLVLSGCAGTPQIPKPEPGPVILISIDGFRADYLQRGKTPTIAALAAAGARSEGMRPSFPSLTFPNHYTLVTGLVPDHHGIVNNRMEDPQLDTSPFTMSKEKAVRDARWWNDGEPVWVTAERNGVRSATMFWPGSEAPIRGVMASFTRAFDKKVTPEARVDQVLAWLDLPAAERPRFLTLYFDQVDHQGHLRGPDSPEVDTALAQSDAAVARLRDGLKSRGLLAKTDLIIVADHGMAAVPPAHTMVVDSFLPMNRIHGVWEGATLGFSPLPGAEKEITHVMRHLPPHMQCWTKDKIPARFRYGTHARVPRYVCLAEIGYVFRTEAELNKPNREPSNGQHGFDPADPKMAALFVAVGPDFKPGVVLPTFDNVDVYSLLTRLLGLRPQPNDGRIDPLLPALRAP